MFAQWTSGDATEALLEILDDQLAASGNDFALDDITFSATAPGIVAQPTDVVANVGDTVTFSVSPFGTAPFTFQWRKNGLDLPGETGATLTLENAQVPATGYYSVVVRNEVGEYTSAPIRLRFVPGAGVTFADANLEAIVRVVLSKPTGALTVADMDALQSLGGRDQGIVNLTGLESAANLSNLDLNNNQIVDLTPLGGLVNLVRLVLENNQISDLTPLSNLSGLRELYFSANRVNDITPLSPLTGLSSLGFSSLNRPTSFAPLRGLTRIEYLNVGDTGLTDLSVVSELKSLRNLQLYWNSISSIGPLSGLSNLIVLSLSHTRPTDYSVLNSLNFPNLKSLELDGNRLVNLAFLSTLIQLTNLNLSDTGLTDYSLVTAATFPNLRVLHASQNALATIEFVRQLPQLEVLGLAWNRITDVAPIETQTQLVHLDIRGNQFSDISALGSISGLSFFACEGNYLDVNPGSLALEVITSGLVPGGTAVFEHQNALPPGLATLSFQSLFSGSSFFNTFTAGDPAHVNDILSVSALSSDQSVVRDSDIFVRGAGAVRSIEASTVSESRGTTTITVTIDYATGSPVTKTFVVSTVIPAPGTLFIEAEDFNFNHGQWVQDQPIGMNGPYAGGTFRGLGTSADRGVDLHTHFTDRSKPYRPASSAAVLEAYRSDSPELFRRGTFEVEVNHVLAWNDSFNWYNYTRTFPTGFYHIYANQASGNTIERAALDEVVRGSTTSAQAVKRLGLFESPGAGSDRNYHLVPLRSGKGEFARIYFDGTRTLRFSADDGGAPNVDYFTLIPAPPLDPGIEAQPMDVLAEVGGSITLSVTPFGTAPFTFQWRKNGLNMLGETGASLTLNNVQAAATGDYSVVVQNSVGTYTSEPVQLRFPGTAVVTFADANLEGAIRGTLNKPAGDVTVSDMESLISFEANNLNIRNLSGLETAINLRNVGMRQNPISDLTPLAGLVRLQNLGLERDQITDIAPLAGCVALENLGLDGNRIQTLEPLRNCSRMIGLGISETGLIDYSILTAQNFPNLTSFVSMGNGIQDLEFVRRMSPKLSSLNVVNNPIASLAPLEGFTELTSLDLSRTFISDFSILTASKFPKLRSLAAEATRIVDVSFVEDLPQLQLLNIAWNPITDIRPIAGLTNLNWLKILGCWISDISPLNTLPPLVFFDCAWNYLDIAPGSPARQTIAHISAPGGTLISEPQRGLPTGMSSLGPRFSFGGQPIPIFEFTAGDPGRVADMVSVTATSSGQAIVRDQDITLRGFGLVHSIEIQPGLSAIGSASVTLSVNYSTGPSITGSFMVTADAGHTAAHDRVGNVGLRILGGADFSANGLGRTGAGSDFALDFGNGGNNAAATTVEAGFLNAAAAGDSITISVWQKLRGVNNATLFFGDSPSVGRGLLGHIPFGDGMVYLDSAGCCDPATQRISKDIAEFPGYTGSPAWWGSWHHLVLTKNGPIKRFYIDGVLFIDGINSGSLPQDFQRFWIGTFDGVNFEGPHGWVDDLAFYNDALTPTEITALAQGGDPMSLPGLAAFWDFNSPPPRPPGLVTQPGLQAVFLGQPASLEVHATGFPLHYQWFKGETELSDNAHISGATTAVLSLSNTGGSDAGMYHVRVSNDLGTVQSSPAELIVHPAQAPVGLGFVRREVYPDIRGDSIADLKASPTFPGHPSQVELITSLEVPSTGDNYGQRLSGLLWPPVTGDYVFYIAADDGGELYLSTDDQPANAVRIASEPLWSLFREYPTTLRRNPTAPENRSVPIHLEAARSYYIEVLQKEGGGGYHVSVAWQLPGGQPPLSGSEPISGAFISATLPALVKPFLVQSPTTGTFSVGQRETLSARAAGLNVSYKWRRNGIDLTDEGRISGSQTSTLAIAPFLAEDVDVYSVVASNDAGSVESEGAIITVRPPGDYVQLAAASRVLPNLDKPGFSVFVHQVSAVQPNTLDRTEKQLLGMLKDTQGNPMPNLANLTQAGNGDRFEIPGVINFNNFADPFLGRFTGDAMFPGLPGASGSYENVAMEVLTYIELPQGVVRMGVNSDDGFETTTEAVKDLFQRTVLGRFDGVRGSADTIFEFYVPEAGVYPFRTIWEQGQQGANIEWFTLQPDGSAVLVNDTAHGGLRAYREVVSTEQTVSIALVHPAREAPAVKLNESISVVLLDPGSKLEMSSLSLEVAGVAVVPEITTSDGRVTVTFSPPIPYPPETTIPLQLSFNETTGASRVIQWSFETSVFAAGTLFIEAGDFDFGKGHWIEDAPIGMTGPYAAGAYQDRGNGLHGAPGDGSDFGIDYFENEPGNAGVSNGAVYRAQTAVEVGQRASDPDVTSRGTFEVQAVYQVGWNDAGDWFNYTRQFPEQHRHYRAFASLSSGGLPIAAELGRVVSGQGTTQQAVQSLGFFRPGRATGDYDRRELFEMTDASGVPVPVMLGGLSTIRFTVLPGNLDVGYLAFVPTPSPEVSVTGVARYYSNGNLKIPGVQIALGGGVSRATHTDGSGGFGFSVTAGSDYTLAASKPQESPASQGVTTLDITLVRRHILGVSSFDSPYKLLAADVSGSGSVSTLDITLIRRVILGVASSFPGGSWVFVPGGHVFPTPSSPWGYDPFRRYSLLNAAHGGQDFIGIKLGDVNGNWTPVAAPPPPAVGDGTRRLHSSATESAMVLKSDALTLPVLAHGGTTETSPAVKLTIDTVMADAGAEFEVPVRFSNRQNITSLQFSLEWNPVLFELVRTGGYGVPGLGAGNLNLETANTGRLSLSWDDPDGHGAGGAEGQELMRMTFRARGDKPSAGVIRFTSDPTPLEVVVDFASTPSRVQVEDGWLWLGRSHADSSLLLPSFSAGARELRIPTWVGLRSVIETSDSLSPALWRVMEAVEGDGTVQVHPIRFSGAGEAYFRVRFIP